MPWELTSTIAGPGVCGDPQTRRQAHPCGFGRDIPGKRGGTLSELGLRLSGGRTSLTAAGPGLPSGALEYRRPGREPAAWGREDLNLALGAALLQQCSPGEIHSESRSPFGMNLTGATCGCLFVSCQDGWDFPPEHLNAAASSRAGAESHRTGAQRGRWGAAWGLLWGL